MFDNYCSGEWSSEECDYYEWFSEICFIPSGFDSSNVEIGETTRRVCRRLCNEALSETCSGFMYDRRTHGCTLTAYMGEWIDHNDHQCNTSDDKEFYRRKRCTSKSTWYSI